MEVMELKEIPRDQIREPSQELRSRVISERIEQLAYSIKQVGLRHPLRVKPTDGKYEIVNGHRRYLACQMVDIDPIQCIIHEEDGVKAEIAKLHENLYRQDVNAIDEGKMYKVIAEEENLTHQELAAMLGRSRSYVTQRINSLKWPQKVKEAVQDELINFTVARELAKLKSPQDFNRLIQWAVEKGATWQTVQSWVKSANRSYERRRSHQPEAQSEDVVEAKKKLQERRREEVREKRDMAKKAMERQKNKVQCSICEGYYQPDDMGQILLCKYCGSAVYETKKLLEKEKEKAEEEEE